LQKKNPEGQEKNNVDLRGGHEREKGGEKHGRSRGTQPVFQDPPKFPWSGGLKKKGIERKDQPGTKVMERILLGTSPKKPHSSIIGP